MTNTTADSIAIDLPSVNEEPAGPDYIEDLFRDRGLKVSYWKVGEPRRVDEEDPETLLVADLTVLYTNGKRLFKTVATISLDVIYGLVGTDEIERGMAEHAVNYLIEVGGPTAPYVFDMADDDEGFAKGISAWTHSDPDIIRAAASNLPGPVGDLLYAAADVVEDLPLGLSFADPRSQLAAVATRIAWDQL